MRPFHVTKNLKFAATLATLGAEWIEADQVKVEGKTDLVFTMGEQAAGITCAAAARLWTNQDKLNLEDAVDSIVAKYGISPEDYALIQLETCRAALGNRGVMLKCGMNKKPFISKTLKSGRQIQYREGTPKEDLRKLINS